MLNRCLSDSTLSRRQFVAGAVAAGVGVALTHRAQAAPPDAKLLETKVVSRAACYHGWPTVARTKNGRLMLVCSGGREAHVCPFGRVEIMYSEDEGKTWGEPQTLLDGGIDDRDAGVLETARGTLLVTTFTSLAYEPLLTKALSASAGGKGAFDPEKLKRWQGVHDRLSDVERRQLLGVWMIRSTDGGQTWSPRYDSLVNSPHGPIQLSDGRLLYAGKDLWREPHRVGVCESSDDGASWRWLADIPVRDKDDHNQYHELHAVETSSGRLIVHIRNHNEPNARETLQTESTDGGKTWSTPRSIGVWGLPSHLLRLRDGRLLMTYGHRRAPLGNQARVSSDEGKTWSDPIPLSSDGVTGDLGYPSTVELSDGSLLTIWYEVMKGSPLAVLRQATWRLNA